MAKKEKQIQNFLEKGKKTERTKEFLAKTGEIVKKEKKKFAKIILIAVIFALLAGSLGTAGYFYYKYKKATTGEAAKNETDSYDAEIKKVILLPEGEKPTLATVTDKEKLGSQPFFAKTENGDKVLIYSQAQKAVLFRPSINKIIEVMPLASSDQNSLSQTQNQGAPATTETQPQPAAEVQKTPVRVVIYNGANVKGLAGKIEGKIVALDSIQVQVTDKTNAKGNYANTLIIDLSGGNSEALEKIKGAVGGEIGNLPDVETKPDADILIIGGSDFKS